jgi:hypothetical protein
MVFFGRLQSENQTMKSTTTKSKTMTTTAMPIMVVVPQQVVAVQNLRNSAARYSGLRLSLSLLLLVLLPGSHNSNTMVHAQMMMNDVVNNCFAEPVGLGECYIGMDENTTRSSYFLTARFGIPNKIENKNKNNNDEDNTTTTAEENTGGKQRVKDCRYAWQVIANHHGLTAGSTSFFYTTVTGSQLTSSDPNCTENCSAVIPSQSGLIFTQPTTFTIRHRFYILPIFEGQNDVNMEWNPFPKSPGEDLPPQFGTFQIIADGVCSLERWEPIPTSTPSITPQPTTTTNPLDSSGSTFGSTMSWPTSPMMVALVVGVVAVW